MTSTPDRPGTSPGAPPPGDPPAPRADRGRPPRHDPPQARQPYLHDLVTCLAAPALWMSPADGQLTPAAGGLFVADRRLLSRLEVRVEGVAPAAASGGLAGAGTARFLGVVRQLGDPVPDPTVLCERVRCARPDGGVETVTLHNRSRRRITTRVTVTCAADLLSTTAVKGGGHGTPLAPGATAGGVRWTDGALAVTLRSEPAAAHVTRGPADAVLDWPVSLEAGGSWSVTLTVRAAWTGPSPGDHPSPGHREPTGDPVTTGDGRPPPGFRPVAPPAPPPWRAAPLRAYADDRRLDGLLERGTDDLAALVLADSADVRDHYFAAGSPWYLTLFGRDALWAARMALPLGTDLAGGTLRALARRQGVRTDADTDEAPGKIPHELRPADAVTAFAPVYYGTVDATPLFVATLADAWRWGMPDGEVAALLPAVERALRWLEADGDPDGDGFVEYLSNGRGLANQGWKDSGDSVQWADGRLADAPIALCEVQSYAYQAAVCGAALLDAFGRPDGDRWRAWAGALAERFRRAYWVADADGPYPAIALDAAKRPVDGVASNMGHLVGTGLLRPDEEALVAARLTGPSMSSGFGLRTLADSCRGFNPLSYHGGSVWPHDTAIAALGLGRAGFGDQAGQLLAGLLAASAAFDDRLPELYSGERRTPPLPPVPYPAACRPQAWSAAVGPLAVRLLLGLDPDVPAGRVLLAPMAPSPVGAYRVENLRVAGGLLSVRVDAAGRATVVEAPPGVTVQILGAADTGGAVGAADRADAAS